MDEAKASRSECRTVVRREGIAAAIGQDLELEVGDHTLAVTNASAVTATFEARSVRVVEALDGDRRAPGKLSPSDKRKIEKAIRKDVLEVGRHPLIRFESTSVREEGDGYRVEGRLTLHGTTRELSVPVTKRDGKLVARVTLHQPDYGIKPFKAFFGALRVKPDVVVEVSVPLS